MDREQVQDVLERMDSDNFNERVAALEQYHEFGRHSSWTKLSFVHSTANQEYALGHLHVSLVLYLAVSLAANLYFVVFILWRWWWG